MLDVVPVRIVADVGELQDARVEFAELWPHADDKTKETVCAMLPESPSEVVSFGAIHWQGNTAVIPVAPSDVFRDVLDVLHGSVRYDA